MSHNDVFISLINNVFTDKTRSILDLTEGATFETIMTDGFDSYFLSNLLKKAEGIDLGVDPSAVALSDFTSFLDEQEEKVIRVAALLDNLDEAPALKRILFTARKHMENFFHDFYPARVWPRFTSGSTLTLPKGASVFARVKASEGAITLQDNFEKIYPEYGRHLVQRLPHTVGTADWYIHITTVGKEARTDRVIGQGPSVALAWQCGLADWMVPRLKEYCNINLSTAPDLHKELAKQNSLDGPLSTQDQRKASDNILRILAKFMVPEKVYEFMDAITPTTLEVAGQMRKTHMLCPAGNGFNTPFQTLLFWCLIKGIQKEVNVRHRVYVYGDDVIVHSDAYDAVGKVFPFLGLEINLAKSFKEGPFRESCGGDYLYGINIRSFYAKCVPQSTIDWIRFANGVRRVGYYNNADTWRSTSIHSLWFWSILHIPENERIFCPRHYGDAGINTESECLYDIQPGPKKPCRNSAPYPNNGYDEYGNPYSSDVIKIYVAAIGGDRTNFATESRGLSNVLVSRLLPSPFLVGAGSFVMKKPDFHGRTTKYPAVFNGKFEYYRKQYVPYTVFGQAPEDIDELFTFISKGAGARICNHDVVLKRLHVKDLLKLLYLRRDTMQREEHAAKVKHDVLTMARELKLS